MRLKSSSFKVLGLKVDASKGGDGGVSPDPEHNFRIDIFMHQRRCCDSERVMISARDEADTVCWDLQYEKIQVGRSKGRSVCYSKASVDRIWRSATKKRKSITTVYARNLRIRVCLLCSPKLILKASLEETQMRFTNKCYQRSKSDRELVDGVNHSDATSSSSPSSPSPISTSESVIS